MQIGKPVTGTLPDGWVRSSGCEKTSSRSKSNLGWISTLPNKQSSLDVSEMRADNAALALASHG